MGSTSSHVRILSGPGTRKQVRVFAVTNQVLCDSGQLVIWYGGRPKRKALHHGSVVYDDRGYRYIIQGILPGLRQYASNEGVNLARYSKEPLDDKNYQEC